MTRIHNTTNFFKPHALQPSGFFSQGRNRVFAGNHPTEAHKRVHFNSEYDRQRFQREKTFVELVRSCLKKLSSEAYNQRLSAGVELLKLSNQKKDLSKYNLEDIKSNDKGVKILVLHVLLKSLNNQDRNIGINEREKLSSKISSTINDFLPTLKEKLRSEKLEDKIEGTTYLRHLCEIDRFNIQEIFTEFNEILNSENETLIDNTTYALGIFAMHGGKINNFLDQLATILERIENTEIKINCLRGISATSLHGINIKKHIPTISKYTTHPSEMISHLAINTLFHYSKNGGDISHAIKDLESAALGVNREIAVSTLVSHIDNLNTPWYMKLFRGFTTLIKRT